MVLMGKAAFVGGFPSAPVVSVFGIAPQPGNYNVVGAIQELSDVAGTLAKYMTDAAADNAEIRGATVGAADMLAADAALGGFVVPTWGAAGFDNERTVVLTYDGGAAPAGNVSVVRGVWKGVDILIFCTFT